MWTKRQIKKLLTVFGRYNSFPSNGKEDEFVIVRENGKRQGIFKEWAAPILPFLSDCKLDEWREKAKEQPSFLEKELRRAWRNSWLIDRDLALKFSAIPLPANPKQRAKIFVERLMQAFSLMSPFYHLEAMVDDLGWLEIDSSEITSTTGDLDVVAFLLPSALQSYVIAETGNWNNLDWPKIYQMTKLALANPNHKKILLGFAGLLGVPPRHIVFAANALQWIPMRVGGKKEDFEEVDANKKLQEILTKSRNNENHTCISVLADMNAKIRFFNWLPLLEGPENFTGHNWTYASVCDTADELFKVMDKHPELWKIHFQHIFKDKLRPQIINLDAASAKGHFLLDLIVNEKKSIIEIDKTIKQYHFNRKSWLITNATHEFNQSCLVGTKPLGLTLASYVLGEKHVLPGIVISMDSIESRKYKHFADAARLHWPNTKLWAVRSSSMDEGTARGVYDSFLRVSSTNLEAAIKKCVKSYNKKNALAFRKSRGPNHRDLRVEMAVLLQPYQFGKCGGVATVANCSNTKNKKYKISVARTAEQVTSSKKTKEYEFDKYSKVPKKFTSLVSILKKLHDVFDGVIQIEWVINNSNKVIVLQMEFMPVKAKINVSRQNDKSLIKVFIKSLNDIHKIEMQKSDNVFHFVIGPEINPKTFQGELFTMVIRLGNKIREITLAKPVSPSSHFANICQHFGIKLT